jgi:chaperonin GroEL (HSP60 family)
VSKQDDMTASHLDPSMRVRTLIALTEELTEIVTRENELLAARRPKDIAPLQAEKSRLAAAYAQSIRLIAKDRSVVAGAGAALIAELRDLTKVFQGRADRQRALIDGARAAGESVVRAIAEEAGRRAEPGYGAARATAAPLVLDNKA